MGIDGNQAPYLSSVIAHDAPIAHPTLKLYPIVPPIAVIPRQGRIGLIREPCATLLTLARTDRIRKPSPLPKRTREGSHVKVATHQPVVCRRH